ncbi:testis-specific serine/threonine-protein kinase 3-like isoform X2 [Agrilus planipennis]|uniref:Testis-specific serine/threonine-protein kinase 3-like isoform X2 n=2 Tax=Agrilus planipennis TaxID=224129 RepID=A0A7F5R867_AGRPL|nr:testis-specific serine/threonine-protein kinase 3-like isoform X2 [Agrilus planipennis]
MPSPVSSVQEPSTAPTTHTHTHSVETKTEKKPTVLESHGYYLGKTIGSGSYATVRVAHSERHEGNVAVKIVSKFTAPADYLKKFLPREIEVVKGLKHPNLIRFLQAIETTHRVYIVMEYAENGSLLDIIRRDSHIDEIRSRKWFRQLVEAVEYCHERGVVHRDIKCENLLMDNDYNIKLSDFGFARGHLRQKNNQVQLSETFCGSYAYASPEILKGVPYNPQMSDVWSMGVVLYAMVFGRLPFDDTNYNLLLKQVSSKVTFPREPKVSSSVKQLIVKVLAPLKVRVKICGIKNDSWYNHSSGEKASTSKEQGTDSEIKQPGQEAESTNTELSKPATLVTKQQLKNEAKHKNEHRHITDDETPLATEIPESPEKEADYNSKRKKYKN